MGVSSFVTRGAEDDDRKFEAYGIDKLSTEALPYYARWIRQDLIGVYYMLNRMMVLGFILLALIAIPLWMIALR